MTRPAASGFTFETTPRIVCRQGSAHRLAEHLPRSAARRVLVVTDRGLVDGGVVAPVLASLDDGGLEAVVFDGVRADPPADVVEAAVALARDEGAELVVGLGGGSAMDTAKLVALLATGRQRLTDVYGIGLAEGPRLPLVAVPTTAGTGSEVTPIAIVTTPDNEKVGVVSPLLYPDIAVLDSTLTLGLPPAATAMTGVDAMVHAIEAYTSRTGKNPLSDTFAVRGLRMLHDSIDRAVGQGDDVDSREQMLLGAMMAGKAFANAPVGAVHALAYPLGGHFHLPHGLCNSLVLGSTLRFNLPEATVAYAELADAILASDPTATRAERAAQFIVAIEELVARMPYPQTLRDAGVPDTALSLLARDAMHVQRLLVNNPREVTFEDALAIYRAAF
jgi:alcohol dehydrogenase class IV